jgi:hypothetical protein
MQKTAAAAVALAMFGLGLLTVMPDASACRCSPGYEAMNNVCVRSTLRSTSARHDPWRARQAAPPKAGVALRCATGAIKDLTMKTYNVHIYREMRLFFPGIVASTAEEAATLAADMPSGAARALEDCDGENLAALVGVIGREDCQQSWMIDFDPVRAIAPDLLTVLALALPILQEVVSADLLSDNSTARLALDRVASIIAKAHAQTA